MKKVLFIICLCAMLVAALSITAVACNYNCNGGYEVDVGSYGSWFFFTRKEAAKASMDKCPCNPVDNSIDVFLRIQYHENNHYYWIPEEDGYFKHKQDTNVDSVEVIIEHDNINYALGAFYARCGNDTYNTTAEWGANN